MVDTKFRVKVFTVKDSSQWTDCGTVHVKASHDDQEGVFLIVKAESDGKLILNSKIHSDKKYEKQQELIILWSETDGTDFALSFQEKSGCDEIWEEICKVRSPVVLLTLLLLMTCVSG